MRLGPVEPLSGLEDEGLRTRPNDVATVIL